MLRNKTDQDDDSNACHAGGWVRGGGMAGSVWNRRCVADCTNCGCSIAGFSTRLERRREDMCFILDRPI